MKQQTPQMTGVCNNTCSRPTYTPLATRLSLLSFCFATKLPSHHLDANISDIACCFDTSKFESHIYGHTLSQARCTRWQQDACAKRLPLALLTPAIANPYFQSLPSTSTTLCNATSVQASTRNTGQHRRCQYHEKLCGGFARVYPSVRCGNDYACRVKNDVRGWSKQGRLPVLQVSPPHPKVIGIRYRPYKPNPTLAGRVEAPSALPLPKRAPGFWFGFKTLNPEHNPSGQRRRWAE